MSAAKAQIARGEHERVRRQREDLISALRAVIARLDQPVLHFECQGVAAILRADAKSALAVARAALWQVTHE